MFVHQATRFVPIASNAFLGFSGVLLERLCSALSEMRIHSLVVDASETAVQPHELAKFDLAEGIETLSPQISFLSAPGLPLQHVDAQGSTAGFLEAVAGAAPHADIVLLHASAAELCRLFGRRAPDVPPPRALILCDDHPDSIKQAYTNIKLLATRADMRVHDTLLSCPPQGTRAAQVADRLARCGETFLGTVQHGWAAVDPLEPAASSPSKALATLARELHAHAHLLTLTDTAFGALQANRQGLASHPAP